MSVEQMGELIDLVRDGKVTGTFKPVAVALRPIHVIVFATEHYLILQGRLGRPFSVIFSARALQTFPPRLRRISSLSRATVMVSRSKNGAEKRSPLYPSRRKLCDAGTPMSSTRLWATS